MSTFKYSKGKLVEQPTMKKPDFYQWSSSVDNTPFDEIVDKYEKHLVSLREYIAEGNFLEDELVEEKGLEFVYQGERLDGMWTDIPFAHYEQIHTDGRRRIIARKATKEEGEKPEGLEKRLEWQINETMRRDAQIEGMRKDTAMWLEREQLLEQEIERLKGLIEEEARAHFLYTCETQGEIEEEWQQFKSKNNLT